MIKGFENVKFLSGSGPGCMSTQQKILYLSQEVTKNLVLLETAQVVIE